MPSMTARIATVALLSLVAGGIAGAAAPGPQGQTSTTPYKPSQPAVTQPKPDLTVQIKKLSCSKEPNASGKYQLTAKVDIRNFTSNKTWNDFGTKVEAPGQTFSGSPHVIAAPLWGGQHQEKDFSAQVPAGSHTVKVTVDWDHKQPETNERNNVASATKQVPQSC